MLEGECKEQLECGISNPDPHPGVFVLCRQFPNIMRTKNSSLT
jgi:hypothetical protein